jgi:hypothetical protein
MPLARLLLCTRGGTARHLQGPTGGGELEPEPPGLQELNHLSEKLSPGERDELLQCLLIAAPRGGEAMIEVLEQLLLCHATEELLEEHG